MQQHNAITVNNLSKIYKLYDKPINRLKEAFSPFKKKYHHNFYALKDISFSLNRGECLGILGQNGAGKSTLLQILTGVVTPTTGTVTINGKISALLELGAGFNPELTGIENIYFKCSLQGLSKSQTTNILSEILSFADIGDFINQPVKTYSSGMFVRLAFAVAINVDPDVLIIDEALSVGDFRFQQKCFRKLNEFRKNNKTIIFVSHSEQSIIQFCTKALWIFNGKIIQTGLPKDVCKDYISYMSFGETSKSNRKTRLTGTTANHGFEKNKEKFNWLETNECKSFGDLKAEIVATSLTTDLNKANIKIFDGGIRVIYALNIKINQHIKHPIIGFQFTDSKGISLLGMNSITLGKDLPPFKNGEVKTVTFEFDFPMLKRGKYSFSPAIASGSLEQYVQHHWVHDAYLVEIGNKDPIARIGCYLVIKNDVTIDVI